MKFLRRPGKDIVYDATGLANPYNLLDEISEVDELVRFDCITTTVDGLNVEQSFEDYGVVKDQIKVADILLLNKKDLLTEMQQKGIKESINAIFDKHILKELNHCNQIV